MTCTRLILIALVVTSFTACKKQTDPETAKSISAAGTSGFASPFPLPPLADIDANVCLEEIISNGGNGTWSVNDDSLVDLGIFHIHDGIEHAGTGDACANRCPNASREAHLPLGLQNCKNRVDGMNFANNAQGRKDKADEMLTCAKAVISYAVCLDGNGVSHALGDIWNNLQGKMCINWGGPTGSHSGHQGWVQWIHYREYCGALTNAAANITVSYEPGKLHMSQSGDEVDEWMQDTPLSSRENGPCNDCGGRHQRCCGELDLGWWMTRPLSDGCDNEIGYCDPFIGRCIPYAPQPPVIIEECGFFSTCEECLFYEGCVWEDDVCVNVEQSTDNAITDANDCNNQVNIEPDGGIESEPEPEVEDAGVPDILTYTSTPT